MRWIPSVPTDNLYKFMAVSGMWMAFGLIVFFGWLVSIDIQMAKESKEAQAYFFSANMISQIDRRIASLDAGKIDENGIPGISTSLDPDQERRFLQEAAKNHRRTMDEYAGSINKNSGEKLDVLKRTDVQIAGVVYILFAAVFLGVGFTRWVVRVHDVDMQMRDLDLQAKHLAVVKLNLEICGLQRASPGAAERAACACGEQHGNPVVPPEEGAQKSEKA